MKENKEQTGVRGAILVIGMLCAPAGIASAPVTLSAVSAPSFGPPVTPGSIATAFGSNPAHTTAWATLDANGNLPVSLRAVSLTVAGLPTSLL